MTIFLSGTILSGHDLYAEEHNDPALIMLIGNAKVSLQDGLQAAATEGQPISAKFEVDGGKLQLSVYTVKAGKFSEVIVDYATGEVSKIEAITEGDDLTAAKAQSAAMASPKTEMAKPKIDLKTAVDKTAAQTAGSRAVSVTPALMGGRAIASVTLLVGSQFKTVEQPLE
jgi:hypothetical protein